MANRNTLTETDFSEVTKEQLIADFKTVMADAEALIKATANQGGDALASVRAKAEQSIALAKSQIKDTEAALLARTKAAAQATDVYVHENPWQAIGISVGMGLLIGFIMGRR
ncbi:hypothetical protein CAP31_06015 [Sulfuriferula sp. AH1]|nr:DUF883 family protein [Sulfuriferula sp. AH1]ARU32866.1 hypothetical protein CAP31_06015 [Sulfuriferula sp. AH1]